MRHEIIFTSFPYQLAYKETGLDKIWKAKFIAEITAVYVKSNNAKLDGGSGGVDDILQGGYGAEHDYLTQLKMGVMKGVFQGFVASMTAASLVLVGQTCIQREDFVL